MMNKLCALALLALPLSVALAGEEEGFTKLFNGKDLDGWHIMNKGQFLVKEGILVLNKGSGWLRSDKEYKDFELRMEFRFITPKADSGIFVRAGIEGANWPKKAYQVQTMDNDSIASLAGGKRDKDKLKKAMKKTEEWQTYAITLKGKRGEVVLNGELVTVSESLEPRTGYIGIQGEGGILEFKNIRVKEIK